MMVQSESEEIKKLEEDVLGSIEGFINVYF